MPISPHSRLRNTNRHSVAVMAQGRIAASLQERETHRTSSVEGFPMSLELPNTFGTFIVIAATAIRRRASPPRTYSAGVRRIDLKHEWLEADRHYAASLATA